MQNFRRWYDSEPLLKEALELLQLQTDDTKSTAAQFIIKLQDQVADEVIESVYEMVTQYSGKGNRWYDNDPVMLKAVELLRVASPEIKRNAALKLLNALENNTLEDIDLENE